ncbi:MAG: CBS domain-containing protein [Bacteroidetes bacterium]|jgi:CBS domain-containing protein|nr:CBS domain-containing protein [Bacteroidota bacterium]MBP6401382.1 CBS domain-containing protein [Bacteroidia bacterium]MBK9523652.1 CBS domain-containing protein [Bacteroidota bacterium]MBK9541398.1 CBS domain-containing protein [Bacteroidota bacterium]MBL0258726.1 CBS domain-containing protein [Bacteroidota bacterium]
MIAKDLINDSFPPLKLSDSGLKAINWMEEFRLEHLPLVDSVNYIGLASEEDILKLSALDQPLANHNLPLIRPFVRYNQPVFEVVKLISKDKLTIVPVLDAADHYIGLVTLQDILKHYSESGIFEDANGVLVLEVGAKSYSLSEIAHIIESEDGKIISSYITPNPENETIDITIKINQRELSRILASFSRHGYFVKEHYHQNEFMDDIKSRYDSLMNYLGI